MDLRVFANVLHVNRSIYDMQNPCKITLTHSNFLQFKLLTLTSFPCISFFFTLNAPTMLCKCFRGMLVYLLYTLMSMPPCNNLQSFHIHFNVFIALLQKQIFSIQSPTTQFCSSFNIDVLNIASTFQSCPPSMGMCHILLLKSMIGLSSIL